MSWDIFAQDLPPNAKTVSEIPSDFKPASIGARSTIIEKIKEVIPTADFSDPSWGLIEGEGWSIEVNTGNNEKCDGLGLHVRGGDEAVGAVATILQHLGLRALDTGNGGFFTAGSAAIESFNKWRAYRDRVKGNAD